MIDWTRFLSPQELVELKQFVKGCRQEGMDVEIEDGIIITPVQLDDGRVIVLGRGRVSAYYPHGGATSGFQRLEWRLPAWSSN